MAMVVKNNMNAVTTLNTLNKNSAALANSLQKSLVRYEDQWCER